MIEENDSFVLKCAYCQKLLKFKEISRDHFIPKWKAGSAGRKRKNLVYSCTPCNLLKGRMLPEEFYSYLLHLNLNFESMLKNIELMLKEGAASIGNPQRKLWENFIITKIKKVKTKKMN